MCCSTLQVIGTFVAAYLVFGDTLTPTVRLLTNPKGMHSPHLFTAMPSCNHCSVWSSACTLLKLARELISIDSSILNLTRSIARPLYCLCAGGESIIRECNLGPKNLLQEINIVIQYKFNIESSKVDLGLSRGSCFVLVLFL